MGILLHTEYDCAFYDNYNCENISQTQFTRENLPDMTKIELKVSVVKTKPYNTELSLRN
jgi:hypothetical protein